MTLSTALQKRIKRRITAQEHRFFVIVSPGLETTCSWEVNELFPEKEILDMDGGIEFSGSVRDCYMANLHLRTATRILMRLDKFRATDFGTLEQKLSTVPWELYLHETKPHQLIVTAKKSKLIHSDAIAERVSTSIRNILPRNVQKKSDASQKIFVRVYKDRFYISLDSSGELLYKRGLKTAGGKAPIRETIASNALYLAGYDGSKPLFDPMCGSGTFSLEAAMIACSIPAGWYRSFAFQDWPCFRPGTWKDIRRSAEKNINLKKNVTIVASDVDADVCKRLRKCISATDIAPLIKVKNADFFNIDPSDDTPDKGIIIINPPYGLRLEKPKDASSLLGRIFHHAETLKNMDIAVISPFLPPDNLSKKIKKYPIFHGGLKLYLIIGKS